MKARLIVLGAAAGGGSPQWNCRCDVCEAVRRGEAPARTQSSIAVTADGERWVLLEASPDLGEQLRRTGALHPRGGRRSSPVRAVVVTDADIDHVGGLLTLREGHAFGLYATRALHTHLDRSPIFEALSRELVPRRRLALDEATELCDADGAPLGIAVTAFGAPGKVPKWAEEGEVVTDAVGEDVVGLEVRVGASRFHFLPSCAVVTDDVRGRLEGSPLVFFDGTVWEDDELKRAELVDKTGRRMGHQPLAGPDGSLAALSGLRETRKVLFHVNNSNPVLLPGSAARREAEAAGWEVAWDGMEIDL